MLCCRAVMLCVVLVMGGVQCQNIEDQQTPSSGVSVGSCSKTVVLDKNFDNTRFSGTWYKIGGLPTTEEISVNCTKYEYIQTATGYSVDATGVDINNSPTQQNSVLRQQESNIGRFNTKLSQIEADIAVINTDYDNYACLHSCYDIKEAFHVQQAWIISRTRQPSRDHIALCQKALFEVGVPIRLLEKVHQGSECTN